MTDRGPGASGTLDVGLEAYLPHWVRERLAAPAEPGGPLARRVEAAVLLVDIVGFKALTERLTRTGPRGAEQLRGVLNRYFGEVSNLVTAYGGDTATFAGDALLAFWKTEGATSAATCLAAARCAIAVRDAIVRLRSALLAPIRQRLAIDFGSLTLLDVVGSDSRRFALLAGEPLRRVAETCRAAEPDTVRAARAAWSLLAGDCSGVPAGEGEATLTWAPAESPPPAWHHPLQRLPDEKLAHYLPRNLVERLLAGQGEWLAEFRDLSIVFVNLGETDVVAAELGARLQSALSAAQAIEARTGGAIYQFLMDDKGLNLILAYGLPLYRQEDDAARAVDAAISLREALLALGFSPAIGVATGQSFCGNCGERRRQYSIIGAPINRAARLMQAAHDSVLFDQATVAATSAVFEFSQHAPGFRVERRASLRQRPPTGALVGRDAELEALLERLGQLRAGGGGLVSIEGEPGVGKSRLLSEFCRVASAHGVTLLRGAATNLEQGTPYYFWREPLCQALGAQGAGARSLGLHVLARLAGRPDLLARAGLLADILPILIAESELSRQASGAGRVAAIHELLVRLLSDSVQARPALLVVEDAHWLDQASLDALVAVAQRVPHLLIVMSSRATAGDGSSGALTKHVSLRVRLEPLQREALAGLISQKLGIEAAPAELVDFALQRTLGHPLFCEELVLSLRDSGAIDIENGSCRVSDGALDRAIPKVPSTLQGVIVSRVDRLPTDEQLTIKVAAVLGLRFSARMLLDTYPVTIQEASLKQCLARLVATDLLELEPGIPEPVYRFKHVLAQESVSQLVLFAQRRELQRAAARWVETHHHDDLRPHLAELALRWELAEEVEKAIAYLEQVGASSLERYANHEAIKALRKAFDLSQQHGFEPGPRRSASWESMLGQAWHELSDSGRSSAHFTRALTLRGYRVAHTPLEVALAVGKHLVLQLCRRFGVWRSARDESRADVAHMFALLGEHWYFENDSFRVLYATLCSLNHAEASSSRRVVGGFGAMAVGLGIAGLHGSAQFYLNQAVAKAEQLGNPADIAYAQLLAGVYAAGKADWGAMDAALGRASELYHGLGDPFRWQQSRSILCFGALVRGEHQLAKGLLQEISLQASRMAFVQVQAWTWSARMALALAENADVSASLAAFEAVRSEALPVSERLLCTGLRAAAELRCGAVEAALASADAGLASMLKSPPTAWHIVPGVRGLAETYLSLLEDGRVAHPQRQELLRKARRACDAIARFAKASRACRPLALRLQARVLHLSGRPHRARPYAQRSLLAARELSLGLDERLAEQELARLGAAPSLGEPRNHEENDG